VGAKCSEKFHFIEHKLSVAFSLSNQNPYLCYDFIFCFFVFGICFSEIQGLKKKFSLEVLRIWNTFSLEVLRIWNTLLSLPEILIL
jgi:hypothetical protein